MNSLTELGKRAKAASRILSCVTTAQKNRALSAIADTLCARTQEVIAANEKDLTAAQENGMTQSLQDRLRLTEDRIAGIAKAVLEIVGQEDPIGRVTGGGSRPNGLKIEKVTVPLGVVGMIYEARPNVTVDAAALCLKSSNVCILRGGKEAIHSNTMLVELMREAVQSAGLPADCILLVTDTTRQSAADLMTLDGYVDVLFPRGGKGLIQSVVKNASVPVIETGAGNCHIFVDASADLEMAVRVCDNAKTSRPSVCNAVETVLVHREIAPLFLPKLKEALDEHRVELRGCARTAALIPGVVPASEEDYATEYDDYILALRVVDTLDEAIEHIQAYSTGHSEAILTNDYRNAQAFTARIDSAAVYVNASTRFTDGGEFGFGAEIGISTQKLHARGPMGLEALCSCKYIVTGDGQTR
ncbi:glutamate-5-semialdehyde dehydrogenase [Anaerotruncus rubiinfantis]|uniref:glutamate-5-semialdehyde dehydrogenase n=1 Tax=Anaerotruncus rubiinfantis TaxID=1720200 RepID=UPI001899DD66|nr:glutamate-5-semialdehyde dehydrogenase [Anaerotruncus rubiinfantis]